MGTALGSVYSVMCTIYSVQCTVYTVHSTIVRSVALIHCLLQVHFISSDWKIAVSANDIDRHKRGLLFKFKEIASLVQKVWRCRVAELW